jgi:hypothetical protein
MLSPSKLVEIENLDVDEGLGHDLVDIPSCLQVVARYQVEVIALKFCSLCCPGPSFNGRSEACLALCDECQAPRSRADFSQSSTCRCCLMAVAKASFRPGAQLDHLLDASIRCHCGSQQAGWVLHVAHQVEEAPPWMLPVLWASDVHDP